VASQGEQEGDQARPDSVDFPEVRHQDEDDGFQRLFSSHQLPGNRVFQRSRGPQRQTQKKKKKKTNKKKKIK
jgi:hypothetical protein